eukprot:3597312-Pleurochrysis_carterae.AAC.1
MATTKASLLTVLRHLSYLQSTCMPAESEKEQAISSRRCNAQQVAWPGFVPHAATCCAEQGLP